VRCDLATAQVFDEGSHVIGLVGAKRDAPIRLAAIEQSKRRLALRRAVCVRGGRIDREPIAVLHQHLGHEAQTALATVRLAIEPGVGIGSRGMRLVRAFLLEDVALAVAARHARFARVVLRTEAIHRSPGIDQM
jgi:hypothetical protein